MTEPLKPNVPELAWWITAVVPFDWKWSKNRVWLSNVDGSKRLAPAAKSRRIELVWALQNEIIGQAILPTHNRLWLSIHVEIPDHTGDAINCLDLVADAVEMATGLDDRWTQLAGLTWSVSKDDPRLHVSIGQESGLVDSQPCGGCGEILPFGSFTKGGNKRGLASSCRSCAKEKRARAKRPRLGTTNRLPNVKRGWG